MKTKSDEEINLLDLNFADVSWDIETNGSGYSALTTSNNTDEFIWDQRITTSPDIGEVVTLPDIHNGTVTVRVGPFIMEPQSKYLFLVERYQCTECGAAMTKQNADKHIKEVHPELWFEEKLIEDHEQDK